MSLESADPHDSNVLREKIETWEKFLDLRINRKRQPQHDEALRGIQPVEDPTVESPLSERHYKRAVLTIVGLQMISRDTPFLRCQADQQSVLLDSDFDLKDYELLGLSSPVLDEVEVGDKEAGQSG